MIFPGHHGHGGSWFSEETSDAGPARGADHRFVVWAPCVDFGRSLPDHSGIRQSGFFLGKNQGISVELLIQNRKRYGYALWHGG